MKKHSKIKTMLIALFVLVLSSGQATIILAEETAQTQVSQPSTWAVADVQMAWYHHLGNNDNYTLYLQSATGSNMDSIRTSMLQAFQATEKTFENNNTSITRGNVINNFYEDIKYILTEKDTKALVDTKNKNGVSFLVEKGIMKGKANGNYALNDICSRQELLVVANRIYNYLTYELDLSAKGAVWKVSDEDNTVYLLGSVHVNDGSFYPLSKPILEAYGDAEVLAVEANILKEQEIQQYVQEKCFLDENTTIDQLISKETYKKYVEAIGKIGIPEQMYNKLKPWYASSIITYVQLSNIGYDGNLGIDKNFLVAATADHKSIIELEGNKEQIEMMDSFSNELQEQQLLSGLELNDEDAKEVFGAITKSWKEGNVEEIEEIIVTETIELNEVDKKLADEYNKKMWNDRNNNMSIKVKDFLQKDKKNDYLVIVGAGHMIGETGIVKQLTESGYVVEQIK